MLLRKVALFLIVFIFAGIAGANVAPLNEADYILTYIPTGDTLQIHKPIKFNPENAKVYTEHYYPTDEEYLAGVTVYSKDYVTSRGVSVGDPVEKVKECYGEPNRPSGSKNHYKWVSYLEEQKAFKVHFYLNKETERVIAINMNVFPVGTPPMIKLVDGEYH